MSTTSEKDSVKANTRQRRSERDKGMSPRLTQINQISEGWHQGYHREEEKAKGNGCGQPNSTNPR
jgi:hypothetical protein